MALVRRLRHVRSSVLRPGSCRRSGRTLFSRVLPTISDGEPKTGYLRLKCNRLVWDRSHCVSPWSSTNPVEVNSGLPRVLSADIPSATRGKYLTIKFDNNQQSQLISQWLRQNCHCPECIDPGSNQRKVYADKLLGSPRVTSAHIAGIY